MMMSEKSENVAKSKSNPGSVRSGVGRAAVILIICQAAFWGIWFSMLEATSASDRGVRLFLLNHAPDELVVVNADNGQVEEEQQSYLFDAGFETETVDDDTVVIKSLAERLMNWGEPEGSQDDNLSSVAQQE